MHDLAERVRAEQRTRWRAGERVLIESYFARHPELESDTQLAIDLIYAEVLLREEMGEAVAPDEYARRFQRFAAELGRQLEFDAMLRGTSGGRFAPAVADGRLPEFEGYEVLGRLGAGGRGVVYRARQLSLNRQVALKVIGDPADQAALALLRREAETVAGLRHPSIVQVYDFGVSGGRPYFAMEYVAGGNLAQKLAAAPLPPREAAAMLLGIARGVAAAHAAGVVHRDLKPANVLLSVVRQAASLPYEPKVADFGLAKLMDDEASLIASGAVVGTPCYMAPEQAECRKDVGPAADIYALGAILHEALVGVPPFKGATVFETIQKVRLDEPPALPRAAAPRALDNIRRKCLSKQPGDRYATAAELADDLLRFLEGQPVLARPARWRVGAWGRAARWPAAASLCGVAILCVIPLLAPVRPSASPDPYDAFLTQTQATREKLKRGEAVELMNGNSQLPPHYLRGSPGATTVRDNFGELAAFSAGFGVVELLPGVPLPRYRVVAKLRHARCDNPKLGMVGVYSRGRHLKTSDADMHLMELVRLNDSVLQGVPDAKGVLVPRHLAWFKLTRVCLTKPLRQEDLPYRMNTLSNDANGATFQYVREQNAPSRLVTVTMEVCEGSTAAELGHAAGSPSYWKYPRLRSADWDSFEGLLREADEPIPLPPEAPAGGYRRDQQTVGLVVSCGQCSVVSFRVEPLP